MKPYGQIAILYVYAHPQCTALDIIYYAFKIQFKDAVYLSAKGQIFGMIKQGYISEKKDPTLIGTFVNVNSEKSPLVITKKGREWVIKHDDIIVQLLKFININKSLNEKEIGEFYERLVLGRSKYRNFFIEILIESNLIEYEDKNQKDSCKNLYEMSKLKLKLTEKGQKTLNAPHNVLKILFEKYLLRRPAPFDE